MEILTAWRARLGRVAQPPHPVAASPVLPGNEVSQSESPEFRSPHVAVEQWLSGIEIILPRTRLAYNRGGLVALVPFRCRIAR